MKKQKAAKILAKLGTILILLTIFSPVLFSILIFIRSEGHVLHFDYLMPAELFPVAMIGGILLIISSILVRTFRALIISSFAAAVVMLLGGQYLAVASGLASGETEPTGCNWTLVLISLGLYFISLIIIGIAGTLLYLKK